MEIATLWDIHTQKGKSEVVRTHETPKIFFYLVKPFTFDWEQRSVFFFSFVWQTKFTHAHIRTIHNIKVSQFELNALKLHQLSVYRFLFFFCCSATIHFSPNNNFRIRLASFSCFTLSHSLALLVVLFDCFVYSGQPKIDVSRAN